MEEIDFGEIQQLLQTVLGGEVDFQEMVQQGMSGENLFSWKKLAVSFQRIFLEEILLQKELWMHILILALAAAVLVHFADVFHNKNVSQISFCVIYMVLFLILITSFQSSLEIAKGVLDNMRDFMRVLAPAYFLAMTLTSYITSAGIYYEFILLLISAVRWFINAWVLPCTEIYVLLTFVSYMTREAKLDRFTELASMLVEWSLKAALALVVGYHMIQGLLSPAADAFRTTSVSKGLQMVPGVGDLSNSVTEVMLGSAMLIKNSMGAAALLVLILLCLVPIVKLTVIMIAYYVLAAVLEPLSDERISGCLAGMGNGIRLLLKTVFTVLLLFLLTVALSTAVTGRTVA